MLAPGVPIERPLGAGGVETFQLELAAGLHWLLRVEQHGIDVTVEVKDPRGRSLLTVQSPLGREGTESLLLTPASSGLHRVEVRCDQTGVPDGRYEIRLEELAADPVRLRAEGALTDAARLYAGDEERTEERAMSKLREALEAWRTLGDGRQEARTWLLLGSHAEELDDYREAVASYGQALTLWRQLDDARGTAAALARLGLAHHYLGENLQALAYLEEALTLRRRLGQRGPEAETRNHLCLVLQRLGRFHEAGACYEKALSLARELEDADLEATVLNNLGGIYQNLGEPATALDFFQQALDLRRAIGDERGEAVSANNLGFYYSGLGEVEKGLRYYSRALAIFERLENRYWQARVLNNVGFAYLSLGEPERARAYLLRALPLRRDVGDRSGEAVTLRNLGRVFSDLEEHGKALAFFSKALEISLAIDDHRGVITARKLLGELQASRRDPAAAFGNLEPALASVRAIGNRQEEAEVLELLSRVHLDLGEADRAAAVAVQALDLHRVVRNPTGEIAALTAVARAARELGQPETAREHLETALASLETLHWRLGDPSQKAAFLGSQRQVYELYVNLLMELHEQAPSMGHDLAALEASERARSRSLLALLESAGAGLGRRVEPALEERLRDAERRLAAKTERQLQVLGRQHVAEEALAAEQELYGALSEVEEVRAEIRRRSPRYSAWTQPQTLDARAIRGLLDDDTVLLEFLLGDERSFLWWVTPASVTVYALPPRPVIEELAGQVLERIGAGSRNVTTLEALAALGQMLLGPVADRLRGQRLVIVADGALHSVPFAALALPGTEGARYEPVLTRHEVVYLPSASVLALQRREQADNPRSAVPKTVAIFADPIFDRRDPRISGSSEVDVETTAPARVVVRAGLDDLGRLSHTRREAEAIAALVPADRRLLALGGDARRSRVVDDELGGYGILHFATHGVINPRIPELSGVVLSRLDAEGAELDGFLGLHDVANLELSAELVVLSGCRTALGRHVRGEGLVGLTRGFMYAGVPRVVASFWQVRDQATAELMARFYRAMLTEELAPAAALRAAQLALRQERRYRNPFYWAAFALQGDWR